MTKQSYRQPVKGQRVHLRPRDIEHLVTVSECGKYPTPKWLGFCQHFAARSFRIEVYSAVTTHSKYVFVCRGDIEFKVRFSNHRPNQDAQDRNDSDFYVGVSNGQVTNTESAIAATHKFFRERRKRYASKSTSNTQP